MSLRYNPHSIEKKTKDWPFAQGESELKKDIARRQTEIFKGNIRLIPDIYSTELMLAPETVKEYGIDACRIATVVAQGQNISTELLESAFKWLNNFFSCFAQKSDNFSAIPWLESALQAQDHLVRRSGVHPALAAIRKAFKCSRPGSNVDDTSRSLVLSVVYPFVPITAGYLNNYPTNLFRSIKSLLECFPDLKAVRFSMQDGGWHWKVFNRKSYEQAPLECLRQVKWVRLATEKKKLKLCENEEGTKICFV